MEASKPIGVFDSGLGGLTILKALKKALPNEQFIYFGDTAHLPYGDKSADTLSVYVNDIAQFLVARQCKMIVVACNSAATVIDQMELPLPRQRVVEVITPIVDLIANQNKYRKVGIIGTRKTIGSGMFDKALSERNSALTIVSRATPLLVPMIEEGFVQDDVLKPIFDHYFSDFDGCELMIPACTHYPMIYQQIETYFNHSLKVLHTPKIVAELVSERLIENNLIATSTSKEADEFHLSDITPEFLREAEQFWGSPLQFVKTLLK